MAKKSNLETVRELRSKARALQKKAADIENKFLCELGKITRKYLHENCLKAEDLPALNAEMKAFLAKQ